MICPKCLDDSTLLKQSKPPRGFDPRLKEYHCKACSFIFYALAPHHQKEWENQLALLNQNLVA